MKFAQGVSTSQRAGVAGAEVAKDVRSQLDDAPDFALLSCTAHYGDAHADLLAAVHEHLAPRFLIGCTAEGVFGGGREFEGTAAVSLLAGSIPGARFCPLRLSMDDLSSEHAAASLRASGVEDLGDDATLILLAEPYTTPADLLLDAVNEVCPGRAVAGGMASVMAENENRLFLGDRVHARGAIGMAISGPIRAHTLVSQGCRPIGRPYVITKSDRNFLLSLGGRRPTDCIRDVYDGETQRVRELMARGLLVGRVINEQQETFKRGDFLVRNVVHLDESSGSIVAGDFFRPGQTIQFHVRDVETADEDLAELLQECPLGKAPAAGLCFSCNGRGSNMFSGPNHETDAIRGTLGPFPLAGHFAAGEFGVVGGRAFIHGHTLSLALIYE